MQRGEDAKKSLLEECCLGDQLDGDCAHDAINDNDSISSSSRIDVIQLDVTDETSVSAALKTVQDSLDKGDKTLQGVVSNAGILWGHSLPELMQVCATGVKRVLDAFVPLVKEDGRVIVVTSGLGPLMHSYASQERQAVLMDADSTWEDSLQPMITQCLEAYQQSTSIEDRIAAFDSIQFPGGPFAESAPDFHMYGLAKMFGDAYMLRIAKSYPKLRVTSVDPGLVYTDLILKMPKYAGLAKEETSAQSPSEGVEGTMQLLFDDDGNATAFGKGFGDGSGQLYALNKERKLVFSSIDKMPQKQE